MPLIEFTDKGLYCPQGQFYIDPWRPVEKAVITHAHSDHARAGSAAYLCHRLTRPILELRLGAEPGMDSLADAGFGLEARAGLDSGAKAFPGEGAVASAAPGRSGLYQAVEWGEPVYQNGVRISLHPAGHIIGSSQVRVEYQGEVWVVSGDYKTEDDGLSGAFEPIPCHVFVTESTFGLPIYNWRPQQEIFSSVREWVAGNQARGRTSVLIAYSLGKAQRLLTGLQPLTDKIYVHGAVWNVHQALVAAGIPLPAVERVLPDAPRDLYRGQVVIAPSGAEESPWMRRFNPYSVGVCSGWMQVRGNVRRRNADAGFALSDHADWKGLLSAIRATGAEKVYVTHGFQAVLSRYLNELGIAAAEVKTEYGEDEEGAGAAEGEGGKGEDVEAVRTGAETADETGGGPKDLS